VSLDDVRKTYEEWGREDPFYAVLTRRGMEGGSWDPEAFFGTGREEIGGVLEYLRGLDVELRTGDALDFGCGVGRLTQALADGFDRVVGVDISSSMVEKARELDRSRGAVQYVVNTRDDLSLFEDHAFDFVYSNKVLQHIPPRYVRRYVADFFRILRPGGIALFQMRSGPRVEPGSLRHWLYRLNREHLRHLLQRLARRAPYEIHFMARSQMEEVVEASGGRMVDVRDVSGRGKGFRYCATAL
jgi:SAM-dependent methyltransferase